MKTGAQNSVWKKLRSVGGILGKELDVEMFQLLRLMSRKEVDLG